jgi:hypothetical protein
MMTKPPDGSTSTKVELNLVMGTTRASKESGISILPHMRGMQGNNSRLAVIYNEITHGHF